MIQGFLNWKNLVVFLFLLCFSMSLDAQMVYAQEKYPTRNIELIIPWTAGGIADVAGRIFGDELSKVLKVPVTPVNKPGATGTLGATFVTGARKDGYTLLVNTISAMVLARFTLPDVPFDTLKDFAQISTISISPSIILVKADSPLKTFEDLINEARKSPGKLTYATAGVGSDNHFNMEHLQTVAKIKMTHVPYKSGGEALTALLGGHVDFAVSVVGTVASQLRAKTIRGVIISGNKRVGAFPDIPTYVEKGYPQHFFSNWVGFFAPAGVPRSVIDTVVSATEKTMKSQEYHSKLDKLGMDPIFMSPSEFRDYLEKDIKTAETLAKQIGIKPAK